MNIVDIGERRIFYMVVDDGRGPVEVPIDMMTYQALALLLSPASAVADIMEQNTMPAPATQQQHASMAEILHQLDGGNGSPQPVQVMPDDLKEKLKNVGLYDEPVAEPDPGEMLAAAGEDETDGEQL